MKAPVSENIKALCDFEGSLSKVARKTEILPQTLSRIIKQNTGIRSETIIAFATAYPNLNLRWFLMGEGEMWLDEVIGDEQETHETEQLKGELLTMYKQRVMDLEREIQTHCEKLAERLELK